MLKKKRRRRKTKQPKKPNIQKITHGKKKGQVKYQIILSTREYVHRGYCNSRGEEFGG
jgi:hypothetical protein